MRVSLLRLARDDAGCRPIACATVVRRSRPVDGFRLAYDDVGAGPAVVLLHGWPGDRTDYRRVVPLLSSRARVVVPDLRGFGESDKHDVDPAEQYSAQAQARSVAALVEELGLGAVVVGGYDVGSGVAHALVRSDADLVRGLVLAPPLPGIGDHQLSPAAQREFWYQSFHRSPLAVPLVDGNPDAVRAHLGHFWQRWSGPGLAVDVGGEDFDRLVQRYAAPGAFRASIAWYHAGPDAYALGQPSHAPAERVVTPLTLLWPDLDPLFPRAWSDAVGRYYAAATSATSSRRRPLRALGVPRGDGRRGLGRAHWVRPTREEQALAARGCPSCR